PEGTHDDFPGLHAPLHSGLDPAGPPIYLGPGPATSRRREAMSEHAHTSEPDEPASGPEGVSRRTFLASGAAGVAAGAAVAGLSGCAVADSAGGAAPAAGGPGQRVLIKGGVVLTMDSRL